MNVSGDVPGSGLGLDGIDADSDLAELGAVVMHGLEHDMDGDGILDTVSISSEDALLVVTDADLDGTVDHITVVEHDGDYAAWEFRHVGAEDVTWERTDHGKLTE